MSAPLTPEQVAANSAAQAHIDAFKATMQARFPGVDLSQLFAASAPQPSSPPPANPGWGVPQPPAAELATRGWGAPTGTGFVQLPPESPRSTEAGRSDPNSAGFGQAPERRPLAEAARNNGLAQAHIPVHARPTQQQYTLPARQLKLEDQHFRVKEKEEDVPLPALPTSWGAYNNKAENTRPGASTATKSKSLRDSRWAA